MSGAGKATDTYRVKEFPIPWKETLEGCRLSVENAERLAEDARILKRNNRAQSAYAIILDAWEELGKAVLLFRYFKQKEDISWKDWKKILRDHKHKRIAWAHSQDLLYGETLPKSVLQLKETFESAITQEDRNWFDLEREVGVYVDWLGPKEHWRSPCRMDSTWFNFPFTSDYWTPIVLAQCKHLRELIAKEEKAAENVI